MARRDGQIIKRGDRKWLIRWCLGQDQMSGKYRYKSKTICGTKRDGERELRRILRSRDVGDYVEPTKMTVDGYLDRWLESSEQRVSPRTLEDYRWTLKRYVRPRLGSLRLEQIRPLDVQGLVDELAREVSPRTVRLAHTILSSALRQAVRLDMLTRNPAESVDLPKQRSTEMRALSVEEVGRLRKELKNDSHAVFFDFLLFTGCRPGEALALRWRDLDHGERRATIRQAVATVRGRGAQIVEPKTASSRRGIPLPNSLVVALARHKRIQAERALKIGAAYDRAADLVFATDVGGLLQLRNLIQRHFKPALAEAGLPSSVRLYDLRHTHATLLLAAGVHPKVAAERLGHATTRQTLDTYSHVLPGMQEEATAKLEAILGDLR